MLLAAALTEEVRAHYTGAGRVRGTTIAPRLRWGVGTLALDVDLAGFDGLTRAPTIEIDDDLSLLSLTRLSALGSVGELDVKNNESLISLAGLEGLTTVGDHLYIADNPGLESAAGLEGLASVSHLTLWGNDSLARLTVLPNLTSLVLPERGRPAAPRRGRGRAARPR